MSSRGALILGAAACFPLMQAASAAVTPIPEFVGEMGEGFEGIFAPGAYPGPIPIFNGAGSMNDTLTQTVVISFIWSGPAGEVLPYNGNLFAGAIAGPAVFQFNPPVMEFGGFLTTVGELPNGTAVFRDSAGNVLDTLPITVQPTQWGWQGWRSDVPMASIEIIGANVPGISMQFDDLQANLTPPTLCVADIAPIGSPNGIVNVDDLLAVISGWGPCANPRTCPTDIAPAGGNDVVNVDDLLAVINGWGACR